MKFLLALCLIVLAALAYAAPPENCLLPKSTGVGRAAIPRFYYNSVSGECEQFGWGGVERGSNANNFETKEKCEAECKVKTN